MRRIRFHLITLLLGTVAAAVLLYLNIRAPIVYISYLDTSRQKNEPVLAVCRRGWPLDYYTLYSSKELGETVALQHAARTGEIEPKTILVNCLASLGCVGVVVALSEIVARRRSQAYHFVTPPHSTSCSPRSPASAA